MKSLLKNRRLLDVLNDFTIQIRTMTQLNKKTLQSTMHFYLLLFCISLPTFVYTEISPTICLKKGQGECYKGSWKDGYASFQGIR